MKKNLLLLALTLFVIAANAQTNVSGGIYANTTWTKVNSPYIVTNTVVVFPGVMLTIEPGVTVKFADNIHLEIRQGTLIAEGTSNDSITFASNSGSPHPGSWDVVFLNQVTLAQFNYCNFSYANIGIDLHNSAYVFCKNSVFSFNNTGCGSSTGAGTISIDSCSFVNNLDNGIYIVESSTISNSNFSYNRIGINTQLGSGTRNQFINCTISHDSIGISGIESSIVNNCIIKSNSHGIIYSSGDNRISNSIIDLNSVIGMDLRGADTVINCRITNNGTGISGGGMITQSVIENNSIGISTGGALMSCNKLCNNSSYDIRYNSSSPNNISVANNYWCTTDSATIALRIYDGYDDINLGLVSFLPVDTTQCYLNISSCSAFFSLIADTAILHSYIATNQAYGTGPLTYVWSWGDGSTSNTAYPSHTYANAGFYTICLSIADTTGCTNTYCDSFNLQRNTNTIVTVNVIPEISTGITTTAAATNFSFFPNPATDQLNITIDENLVGVQLNIYNVTGALVRAIHESPLQSPQRIDVSNLPSGVYIAEIKTKEASIKRRWVKM